MATTNPFDIPAPTAQTAPGVTAPAGLVDAAMGGQVTAPTSANQVAQATGANYTAANAGVTNWDVDPSQTVAGNVDSVLAKGSPLLEKAQADALQTANSRGLLNSSMAAGAGTSALLDKALQIATPDAATRAAAGQFNAGAANTGAQFNANAANTAGQFNAQTNTSTSLANTAARNSALSQDTQANLQAQTVNLNASLDAAKTQYQGQLSAAMANMSEANKVGLANLDASVRQSLAGIEAQFKTQMQTSQSAAMMYGDTMKAIGAIMTDPNLDADAKQQRIDQQMASLTNGLNLQMAITNIPGVVELVSNLGAGVTTGGGAPPPAPGSSGEPSWLGDAARGIIKPIPQTPLPGGG